MSIDVDLNRIATALEEIVKIGKGGGMFTGNTGNPLPPVATPKTTKAAKETPAPVAEPEVDPFSQTTDAAEPIVNFESLTDLLKLHAKKLGTKVTVALIIKHGADRTTPKMNTIPEANFKTCFEEASADLKKVEGKK